MAKNELNQLNLTVVALVALVAIVGLVALVLNAGAIASVPYAGGVELAEASDANLVGEGRSQYMNRPIKVMKRDGSTCTAEWKGDGLVCVD